MTWTILVADDQPAMRLIVRVALEGKGSIVVEAGNGMEAMQKAVECQPDLILLDVMMPGMDGITACQHLKHSETTKHIPIIMFSADATAKKVQTSYEAGADVFLEKPIPSAKLNQAVFEVLTPDVDITLSKYPYLKPSSGQRYAPNSGIVT